MPTTAAQQSNTEVSVSDLNFDSVMSELHKDQIFTSNPQLEASLRGLVDDANGRGIENLKIIAVDIDPQSDAQLMNLARQIVEADGGTAVVRSPSLAAAASDEFPRAALDRAQYAMVSTGSEYPDGLNKFLTELTDWVIPWTIYSLIVGIAIVAIFSTLIVQWWKRSHA